jgi:hypothetical protein
MSEPLIPAAKLIQQMMAEAARPVTMKGGAGARMRRQQDLMRQAAIRLAKWGRPPDARRAQPADLFAPDRR